MTLHLPQLMRGTAVASLVVVAACATGSTFPSDRGGTTPRTRAERTGYLETSHYTDVVAFLDSLKGRPELAFGTIGRTNEGRDIPYIVASRPRVSTPEEARKLGRPVVYVQGNIHAGEVDGKETLLALLRDLTSSSRPNALDRWFSSPCPSTTPTATNGSRRRKRIVGRRMARRWSVPARTHRISI